MSEVGLPVAAYLVGSISFSYLVVWLLCGRDVREFGSGNAGATNVLRAAGLGPAIVVLVLDVAKGAAPVVFAGELGATAQTTGATAAAAVAGHVFPIYLRFRGGKGVATALGALAALAFWPIVACVAVILLIIAWTRYVSLGSIVGVTLAPILMFLWEARAWSAGVAAAIAVLVIARHAGNIRRLWAGSERRLGEQFEVAR